MAIAVKCRHCGKELKAKDELAGKTVRCPGCQEPLKIGGAVVTAGKSAATSSAGPAQAAKSSKPNIDVDAAIAKVEEARRKKVMTEEELAARQDEVNKLVGAWDQMAGKGDGKDKKGEKKKDEKIGEKPTQVTIKTKVQDRVGILTSTAAWKYVVIVVLLVAAAWGSSQFIGTVMHTSTEATAANKGTEADIPRLYQEARGALAAKNYALCRDKLQEILYIQPHRENNIEFKEIKSQLEKALAAP